MNSHLQWTPIALQSLSEVLDYTFEEFGERQLHKLTSQISDAALRIATFPRLGKYEADLSVDTGIEYRSMLVISEIKLLYTISDDIVFIEYVKNTRQDDATVLAKLNERE